MKSKLTEKGQALILIVFGIVAMVALTGLAIDGSATYTNRQGAQNAADAAALAGALQLSLNNTSNVVSAATNVAQTNGSSSATNAVVTVNNPPSTGCGGATNSYVGNSEYVQVIINTDVPTTFAPVVGIRQMHNCVEAIAYGRPAVSGSTYGGAALVAIDPTDPQSMLFNGGATVQTKKSGVFVNSNNSQALFLNGGAQLTMDSNAMVVGGYKSNGNAQWSPGITTGATALTVPDPAWATIPAIPTSPTCGSSGSVSGSYNGNFSNGTLNLNGGTATLTPGNYANLNTNSNSNLVFSPGTYCISGSLNIGGTVTGTSGKVQLVTNSNINLNGGVNVNFSDLEIYTTNGSWIINGGASMTATRLRFYSTGSSTFIVNGNATLNSSNAFFYMTGGYVRWNGGSTINLQGPPAGDPYAGLLIYLPWSNTSPFDLNGGSTVNVQGTILAPHSNITANGGSNFAALNSQVVGYKFIFNGGGSFVVSYDAKVNWSPTQKAVVQLVK